MTQPNTSQPTEASLSDSFEDRVRTQDDYDGAMADLDLALDVLIKRINGEHSWESAAEWLRLNYPEKAKALTGEPMFVLRAQDATAAATVRHWALINQNQAPELKIEASLDVANAMDRWPRKHVPD